MHLGFPNRLVFLAASVAVALAPATRASAQEQPAVKSDRTSPVAADASAALPNGASSIKETYGDWTVSCAIVDGAKSCAFSQAPRDQQTGQRLFAIEFRTPQNGKTDGMLLMPFGLKLAEGVRLKIDEQNLGQGAPFSTCYPQGCLAPISFPSVATDALKNGTMLVVTASSEGGGETPTFSISLNGFTAAMSRATELAK